MAENESAVGLSPMVGVGVGAGTGVTDNEGGASTSVRPGICVTKVRMLLPPPDLVPEDEFLPAAARGMGP